MSGASNTMNTRANGGQSGEILELRHRSRKPRILIAGEFSAGKSTLVNALLGEALLPQNVTATALPPMWIVSGRRRPLRFDREGKPHPLVAGTGPQLHETSFCLLSRSSALLDDMDLIDTPGHSDPNMSSDYWERMVGLADAVVWCSNAVQAWRQSELAIWQSLPRRLTQNALLILSHADRLIGSGSGEKVVARVQREAGGLFGQIRLASLVDPKDILRLREDVVALAHSVKIQTGAPHPGVDAVLRLGQPAGEAGPRRQVASVSALAEANPAAGSDKDHSGPGSEAAPEREPAPAITAGAAPTVEYDQEPVTEMSERTTAPETGQKVLPRKPRGPRRSGHQRPEPEQLPEVAALPVSTGVIEAEIKPFVPLAGAVAATDDAAEFDRGMHHADAPAAVEAAIAAGTETATAPHADAGDEGDGDLVAAIVAEDRAAATQAGLSAALAAPLPVLTLSPVTHGVGRGLRSFDENGQRRIAREIWDEVARGHDMANPSAILACVMQLLSRVDGLLQAAGVSAETALARSGEAASDPRDPTHLEGTSS